MRVWNGGAVIGSDNEINGITFAGVGNGTVVDHVEVVGEVKVVSAEDGARMVAFDLDITPLINLSLIHI